MRILLIGALKQYQNRVKKGKINNFSDGSISTDVYFVNLSASVVPDIVDWN